MDLTIATIWLVAATLLLSGVTIWQGRSTVNAVTRQRKDAAMPFVVAEGFSISPGQTYCIDADIKNFGKGPAINIEVEFFDDETGVLALKSKHVIPYLIPDQKQSTHIHISEEEFKVVRFQDFDGRAVAFLRCRLTFKDIYMRGFGIVFPCAFDKKAKRISITLGEIEFHADSSGN
ncbi:MAG: hypothetical protein KGI73_02900 [Patescibacteria group bacterium]|nr:hypothetical protein [Patescibacteria group bacterium]